MIAILDYGIGNLGSIKNMIRHVGGDSQIVNMPEVAAKADALILPGVGSFDVGMAKLNCTGLLNVVKDRAQLANVPILGICLGMQLLFETSEEGSLPGLGLIPGRVIRFKSDDAKRCYKIPHMGWNTVLSKNANNTLFANLPIDPRFYFVHSYHVVCDNDSDISMLTEYVYKFPSAVKHGSVYGVQFHPEKSHRFGMQFFRNFLELTC